MAELGEKEGRKERKKNAGVHGKKVRDFFLAVGRALKNALFPEDITCDACGDELRQEKRYRLCDRCEKDMPVISGSVCLDCGVPIFGEGEYCLRCQREKFSFEKHRAPLVYDGIARQLVHDLKFRHRKYVVHTLGAYMADLFISSGFDSEIAVFVPMTEKEEKARGFNQAELLAENVADRLKLPLLPALVKTRDTSAQKSLSKKERAENLENGVFACVFKEVKGRKILLVDDIFTTGATTNACAKVLLEAGAKKVNVLTATMTELKVPMEVPNDDGSENGGNDEKENKNAKTE